VFGKRKPKASPQPSEAKQYPDELADAAAVEYGSGCYATAAEGFATAIDKLHTMEMVAANPIRCPGDQDQYILDGLRNSVGAALAAGQVLDRHIVESAMAYLRAIGANAGPEGGRYLQAVSDIEYELQRDHG
jgi:hypothetical protein